MGYSKDGFIQLSEVEYYESEIGQLKQNLLMPAVVTKQRVTNPAPKNGKHRKN
jgi:hypothetical protein